MNSIFAIALISIRNAIRSKIVIVLLTALLLALIGLPFTLQGDGTMAGHVRVLLRYTLGLATLILSIATVWASCAAVSTEIRDRQIQLIVSKPVRASQLWLGKWLGLMVMNIIFVLLCFVFTYAGLRWTTQPDRWTEEEIVQLHDEILVAQHKYVPRPRDVQAEVQRRYRAGRAREEWPRDMPTDRILPRIERQAQTQANSVRPNERNRWVFDIPDDPPPDRPLVLQYQFSLSVMELETVPGTWIVGDPAGPDRQQTEIEAAPRTRHTLSISPERIGDDGTLTVEFVNLHERAVTVIFAPAEDLHLMVYAGGFAANYLRAALLILFHLAFLAAIGVTAGAYFSIPVAALTSFYALLVINAARFIGRVAERGLPAPHTHGPHEHSHSRLEHVIEFLTQYFYRGLHAVLRPLEGVNPLDYVAIGQWIPWSEVGQMFLIKVLLYSGLLLALGAWHIAHKEVALPS